MRQKFGVQLMDLKKKIVKMGDMVQSSIELALQSLDQRDLDLADKVIESDSDINNLETEIEQLCTHLVATQQPFASDLRTIVAGYKMISSLERMGDLAVDIAKVSKRIGPGSLIKPLIDLPKMKEIVVNMINFAIDAYINEDVEKARELSKMDNEVDHYYKKIFEELNEMMGRDAKMASQGVYLLLVARYMERIGDYCTNLGEEIIYMELGVREDLNK
ncbi:MAG: phosphate signaling complex protein PhoU [Eubacteriales bacterium]